MEVRRAMSTPAPAADREDQEPSGTTPRRPSSDAPRTSPRSTHAAAGRRVPVSDVHKSAARLLTGGRPVPKTDDGPALRSEGPDDGGTFAIPLARRRPAEDGTAHGSGDTNVHQTTSPMLDRDLVQEPEHATEEELRSFPRGPSREDRPARRSNPHSPSSQPKDPERLIRMAWYAMEVAAKEAGGPTATQGPASAPSVQRQAQDDRE
jgi:hypothetical protein